MPTSETATKTQTHIGGGGDASSGGQRFPVITAESSLGHLPSPHDQMTIKQEVMVEHTNVPANNMTTEFTTLAGATQLSNFDALDTLQGGFERLQGTGGGDGLDNPVSPGIINVETKPPQILVATCSGASDTHPVFVRSRQTDSQVFLARHPQQVVSTSGLSGLGQVSGKWPAMVVMSNNNPGQVVTKVIITKNPVTCQPQAVPALGNTVSPNVFTTGDSGNTTVLQQQQHATLTKAISVSHCGVLSPQRIMTAPSTPTKQILPSNKIPISPMKTPPKITMLPMSMTKSPQRLGGQVVAMVARTVGSNVNRTPSMSTNTQASTITMSPSKVIIKGQQVMVTNRPGVLTQQQRVATSIPVGSLSTVQPLPVAGSKFQYVRLVTTSTTQPQSVTVSKPATIAPAPATIRHIAPASGVQTPLKIALSQTQQLVSKPVGGTPGQLMQAGSQSVQRLILPVTSQVAIRPNIVQSQAMAQIRPSVPGMATATQLPLAGTSINLQGMQGFALLPAQYVAQIQQQIVPQPQHLSQPRPESSYVPIASTGTTSSASKQTLNGAVSTEPAGHRPRKPCNCTKSQCLKLYCDCFANGEFCSNCNCTNCANNLDHEEERSRAIKSCLDRNPMAFHPKIGKGRNGEGERRHNKGCNCKRSGCLKNYCECYEDFQEQLVTICNTCGKKLLAKILCSNMCKCVGCKNFEESPDRKTLMHLADAAEVRVQQQTAAKTKLSSQMQDIPMRTLPPSTGEKLPYTFVTTEVVEAACSCLLAQAEEAERLRLPEVVQERMVLEEFGRCIMQVIESANKTRAPSPVP